MNGWPKSAWVSLRSTHPTFWAIGIVVAIGVPPTAWGQSAKMYEELRDKMVDQEVVEAGVENQRVIDSMRATPRHEFVSPIVRRQAYYDMALPIGAGQTISPPFIVAYMTEQLGPQPEDKVLEIGTGSGYQAAVLSPLCKEVYSIEIVESLGKNAAQTLRRLKYQNVFTKVGDGYQGWTEHAPFDRIIVTCSPEDVPQALVEQLKEGGRLLIPVGERYQQTLYRYTKINGQLTTEVLLPVLFVPMTGAAESEREVQPDSLNPSIVNGGFEELAGATDKPAGWHYQRYMSLESDSAPEGGRYVTFENEVSGRYSQCLQGFAIDGRKVARIELSIMVKGDDLKRGEFDNQQPAAYLTVYDGDRRTLGTPKLGPWQGDFDWKRITQEIPIPPACREAILHVGLHGGTGKLSFDDVRLTVKRER